MVWGGCRGLGFVVSLEKGMWLTVGVGYGLSGGFLEKIRVNARDRRGLTASLKTERQKKKELYFPLRKYAIKA
ncbi:hypothetical protein IEQ34_017046 [Dendrobium chrysotoxum]|uniref:Uncharacterized protein n=1 Tax=Dendrobium chrysotoxum TaxID=161865 RepID=A0AAV7GGV5_DENCH|nr:hypothetical protein IEQ34_017046 [Dendrobium chrysotoxum]